MHLFPKVILSSVLIAACAGMDITQPPIVVAPTNQFTAVGIDVYGRERDQGGSVPRFRGQETVEIRTQIKSDGLGYDEIADARCTLDSGVYKATFLTPANVVVPDYGPDSPSIFVQCIFAERSGSTTAHVINKTQEQRSQSANTTMNDSLLGALVVGVVVVAARNNETDDFGYDPIKVRLE